NLGLSEHVHILYEPLASEVPAQDTTLVLVTARTAQLQHTAVCALQHGLPVLAFAASSPLADSLQKHGLQDICLSRLGDFSEMAYNALTPLQDDAKRTALSSRLLSLDWRDNEFEAHVSALRIHGRALSRMVKQEQAYEA